MSTISTNFLVFLGVIADRIQEIFYEFPTEKILWLPVVTVTDYVVLEFVYTILYHIIPAIFFDFIFKIWGSELRYVMYIVEANDIKYVNNLMFFSD